MGSSFPEVHDGGDTALHIFVCVLCHYLPGIVGILVQHMCKLFGFLSFQLVPSNMFGDFYQLSLLQFAIRCHCQIGTSCDGMLVQLVTYFLPPTVTSLGLNLTWYCWMFSRR